MTRLHLYKGITAFIVVTLVLFSASTVAIFLGTGFLNDVEPGWVVVLQKILIRTEGNFASLITAVLEMLPVLLSIAIFKKEQPDPINLDTRLTPFEKRILTILAIGIACSVAGLLMFDKDSVSDIQALDSGLRGITRIVEINQIALRHCLMLGCLVLGLKKANF